MPKPNHLTMTSTLLGSLLAMALTVSCIKQGSEPYSPKSGDLIFQTSRSLQSRAVQKATGSPLSHMGIVYVENGAPMVYEANGRVQSTPLETWINRGEGAHYSIKRLRDARTLLTRDSLVKMREIGESFRGKPYDICFEWSDSSIYCSELGWKIYDQALGVQVGQLEKLADFDLSSPEVRQILVERANCRLDPGEVVISPAAMFDSELLILVHEE